MSKKWNKIGMVECKQILKYKSEAENRENFEPMVDAIIDQIQSSKKYKKYKISLTIEGK